MLKGKLISNILLTAVAAFFSVFCLFSCAVIPKDYPVNKPFVHEYNINLIGNFTTDQRAELISGLRNQLDDSIRVRTSRKFFYKWKGINRAILDRPPVYDSANADKSTLFMKTLLNKQGYFKDTITYDTTLRVVGDQYRTTVNFNVKPGKLWRLDTIIYDIKHTELQQLARANMKESYLREGGAFTEDSIAYELDRLVEIYRNNGYMRFTRDELLGVWDTLDVSLLDPSLDPFAQLELLQKLQERRANPKVNLEIRLRPGLDTNRLTKFTVGTITVYPDYGLDYSQDTSNIKPTTVVANRVKVVYVRNLFKPKILPQSIYLIEDSLYRNRNYVKTINRFNSLGSWRQVNVEARIKPGRDTVDFDIFLTPARKYSFTQNLEGSRNASAISGNLFGLAINHGLQNRNFARAANQTNTTIRYGIETGKDTLTDVSFTQTRQLSLSHTIYFPRPIPNSKWIPVKFRENFRSIFSFNAATTERRTLYNLTTVNGSWGYESQWKNKLLTVKIPNIEYSFLRSKALLDSLFKKNPSLKNVFTDGFISSMSVGFSMSGGQKKNINLFRANFEESGIVAALIPSRFLDSNLYRFIKVDAEFIRKIVRNKTSLVLRLFTGVGYEFNSTVDEDKRHNLPFFKQYFGGGPNSMRAWALRKLGQGSTIRSLGNDGVPERYGDVQIEGNIEYRFPLFNVQGVKINGALFTDIGNVWFLKKLAGRPTEEVFNITRIAKDLAVGAGIGLRIDFSFLVLRLDYGYKVKDPSPQPIDAAFQNRWFGYKLIKGDQFQLGISYPFIL